MTDSTTAVAARPRPTHPDQHATPATVAATPPAPPPTADAAPALEGWVRVVLAAFVPAIGCIYAPEGWRVPLFAVAALLFAAGLVMLVRQERGRAAGRRR